MGHRQGGTADPHLPQLTKQLPITAIGFLCVFWSKKKRVEIHWTDGLKPLHSRPRLPSNSGRRKKMEILKASCAPSLLLLHIRWVLEICLWWKRSRTCTTTTKPHFSISWQALGTVCNAKPWTWLCLFFFFLFLPSVTTETDGYFFLGVGRAIWLQCLIVIIADSDTLLASSSLLLRQLPFNKKRKGEQRTGTAEKCQVWVPARARLQQINAPTLGTWKGPERFWLSLIKGSRGFAAALSLGRTKLLESSLFWFFIFFKWLSWKKKFIQGGSLVTTSWKHLKNLEN